MKYRIVDFSRPNGETAVKVSGKKSKCHMCMVMEIDDEGKVGRIDEYYNKRWDDDTREEEYAVMRASSLEGA